MGLRWGRAQLCVRPSCFPATPCAALAISTLVLVTPGGGECYLGRRGREKRAPGTQSSGELAAVTGAVAM